MFASIQLHHRSNRSPFIATDVFEQASLSILRRYQQAASPAFIGSGDAPAGPSSQARQQEPGRFAGAHGY